MQELVIVSWCDVCRTNGETQSKAVLALKLTVDGITYGLDLCDTHQAERVALDDLTAFLEQYAIKDPNSINPRARAVQAMDEERPYQCPICVRTYLHRNSLAQHTRTAHGRVLSALEEGTVTPVLRCELCGATAKAAQGLAAHKRSTHGIPGKAAREAQARQGLAAASG